MNALYAAPLPGSSIWENQFLSVLYKAPCATLKNKMQNFVSLIQSRSLYTSFALAAQSIKSCISDALCSMISAVRQAVSYLIGRIKGSPRDYTADDKKCGLAMAPLVLAELSHARLNDIFDNLEMHNFGESDHVSQEIKVLARDPALWQIWAMQLAIPFEKNENPKAKIISLLSYFKIDPKTRKATILKNINSVKNALKIYPAPAYLVSPIQGTNRFNFFYRQVSGECGTLLDLDRDSPFSETFQKANEIVNDSNVTALSLL